MSQKNVVGSEVPYAELLIKAADSRPICITIDTLGGDIILSPGDSHDAVEALTVLNLMAATCRSVGAVRLMKEEFPGELHNSPTESNDIPF